MKFDLRTCSLGTVEYEATAQLQRGLRAAREAGAIGDVLLLLEHDPVITCGSRTEPSEIAYARTTDVPVVPVERGGKATYHGPGQVVAYPIVDLDVVDGDVRDLVHRLEQAIIDAFGAHGLTTGRRQDYPGVWVLADHTQEVPVDLVRPRKIASVGLRLTRGITFHGVALNVACDLTPFGWFTPCGIADAEMTSLARELGLEQLPADELEVLVRSVEQHLADSIARQFGLRSKPVRADDLRLVAQRFEQPRPDVALPGEPRRRGASRQSIETTAAPAAEQVHA